MKHSREYNIFENMMKEYLSVDVLGDCDTPENKKFTYLAVQLCDMDLRNPLTYGETGYDECEDMMFFYKRWDKTKKTCAFRQRFIMSACELCDVVLDNIFDRVETVSLDALKEQELNETEKEDIESGTYVPVPEHIFGVVEK